MARLSLIYFLEIILQALFKSEGAMLKTSVMDCHTIEQNIPKILNNTHRLDWCKQAHFTELKIKDSKRDASLKGSSVENNKRWKVTDFHK